MKIRLQIAADGYAATFEHAGPAVMIGRDPACELALDGPTITGVSRQHARIDLTPAQATLADAGSSNGTIVNDEPISGPIALRKGDRIRLGFTGPTLTVLDLDLSVTAPTVPAKSMLPLIGAIGSVAAVAAMLIVGLMVLLRKPGPTPTTTPDVAVATSSRTQPAPTTKPADTGSSAPATGKAPPPPPPPPPPPQPDPIERPVGRYLALDKWGPSVLLSRRGEAYPWTPLRPESPVVTSRALMSLPGYRSEILLDSQVQLTLWGNVPQLCGVPPLLLESAIMLNVPDAGVDLDVTLEWGRIKLANRKSSGTASVRLRFARETWEITLPSVDSEVCAELWSVPVPPPGPGQKPPHTVSLGLFTKGPTQIQRTGPAAERFDLPDKSRVAWVSGSEGPIFRETMQALPGWWVLPTRTDRLTEVQAALNDWAVPLGSTGEVTETIQKTVAQTNDPATREAGMAFLAALDGAPFLVAHLEAGKQARTRRAAAHALRAWLGRSPEQAGELLRLLQTRVNTPQAAARVLDALYPPSDDEVRRPETYQKWIANLSDESLAVRELSTWKLEELAPAESTAVFFDPDEAKDKRQVAITRWQKELPPGQLPKAAKQ